MVISFQQSLRPLFLMCFIMGLGFFPRTQSRIRWVAYLSILYFLTIWSTYMYLFLYVTIHFERKKIYDSITMEICVKSNFLLFITSVIMSFYHQKRFETSMKKLAFVDDTLEKLGTPKIYDKLHKISKQMIISWIMYSLTINFFDTVWWLNFKEEMSSWILYMAHIVNHCIHINAFVDMLFIFFLWYIGTRFDKVNEHMQCLLVKENHELRYTWEKSVVILHQYTSYIDYKRISWSLLHLHSELTRLSREINMIFTVKMTFEMIFYFLYLTLILYSFYLVIIKVQQKVIYTIYDWCSITLWIIIFIMRFCIVNYICETVTVKANKISKLLHQLTCIRQYADIWKEIHQFILQTMHHPLRFTAMGLFYFNYEFLRKFFMALVMYVIIVVQFQVIVDY